MAGARCRGRLLVATPTMQDPNFSRVVVLIVAHSAEGAVGVVLNRPSSMRVDEALPRLVPLAEPEVLFMGGPVGDGALLALGAPRRAAALERGEGGDLFGSTEGVEEILPGVGLIPIGEDGTPGYVIDRARLFVDYAGWSPGQLDAEINHGDWLVLDALPADAFTSEPDALWVQVLRRQGGRVAWLANAPRDPTSN